MSPEAVLLGLCLIVVLSILARLFGDWAGIPVIVPLLVVGVLVGDSVTGIIEPEKLLGGALSPFVQIVVALILFEGALGLRFRELPRKVRPAVLRLITLGVLITWALGSLGAIWLLDLPTPIAILTGAILIVSGPTVVLPLLAFVRPPDQVRATLKWEGVIMDPIGALVAVVVFAAISAKDGLSLFSFEQFALSVVVGVASGIAFAALLMPILATHRFSGRDKVAATLMMVVAAFLAADLVFQDAGLAAALVMGVALANQSRVNVSYIDEFKETLIPILLGILFVILAADVDIGGVIDLGLPGLAFIAFLSFLVRPLAVLTTIGLPVPWKERLYMMTFSARGIVAAATAPVFGLVLVERGVEGADQIVPVVFLVIAGTVLVSSILSPLIARRFGLSGKSDPSMVFLGTPRWAIALGKALKAEDTEVRFWTPDLAQAKLVEQAGLEVSTNPLNPRDPDRLTGLEGVSVITAASADDIRDQLLAYDLSESLEPDQIYRVPGADAGVKVVENAGRVVRADIPIDELERRVEDGAEFQVFDSDDSVPEGAVPLVVIETSKSLDRSEVFFLCDRPKSPRRRTRRIAALVSSNSSPA